VRAPAYEYRHWGWQLRTDHHRFAGGQHGDELGGSAIEITAGSLYGLAILIIGQAMDDQGAKLAQHIGRHVAGALRCEHAGQPIL